MLCGASRNGKTLVERVELSQFYLVSKKEKRVHRQETYLIDKGERLSVTQIHH